MERVLALLTREGTGVIRDRSEIEAVGHRMVHGGEHFKCSVRIDDEVLRAIEECFDIAPLHNPPNVKGYRAARELLRDVPHVAVFDTSFHQTMAPVAFLYALPYVLYERHAIRRYGFHGTSHRFVSRRSAELLGRVGDPALRVITCHLGQRLLDHGRPGRPLGGHLDGLHPPRGPGHGQPQRRPRPRHPAPRHGARRSWGRPS